MSTSFVQCNWFLPVQRNQYFDSAVQTAFPKKGMSVKEKTEFRLLLFVHQYQTGALVNLRHLQQIHAAGVSVAGNAKRKKTTRKTQKIVKK